MNRLTEEEKFIGVEDKLNLINLSKAVEGYIGAIYGNEKEVDRLLSFKVGNVCKNQIMDLIESIIVNAINCGKEHQKDINNEKLLTLSEKLEIYENERLRKEKLKKRGKV